MDIDGSASTDGKPLAAPPAPAPSLRLPIESSHVMMFARSLGEQIDGPQEVAARDIPVTFPVALAHFDPDYELRPHPARAWFGSGSTPGRPRTSSEPRTRLHAEQHFEYHRRVRPGEVLTATRRAGNVWEKTSSRGGVLTFTESFTDFTDDEGNPVLTSRSVSVYLPLAEEQKR